MSTPVPAPTTTAPTATAPDDTVLPRPVEPLPLPALSAATRKLADRFVDQHNFSEAAAQALATAVVDPSEVRRFLDSPERIPVPGGTVLAVRARVWARKVMPDPRNPRISPSRRHPASGVVGKDERTRFAPLPEPIADAGGRPELIQRLANSEHLSWSAIQARDYILKNNDWRVSIRNQGVMSETWIAATTFVHDDDTPDAAAAVTVDGSSRITCDHDLLDVRSADVLYGDSERGLRSHIRKLNEQFSAADGAADDDLAVMLRCEIIPALLLVGYESHDSTVADFGVAVKSLVALRHVDYPKPWGAGVENESLADAVIDELARRDLITPGRARWLLGEMTPQEAAAAGFSDDPAVRAGSIVRLFTDRAPEVYAALRCAITTQSTRSRITTKLLLDIATSLILRSLPEEEPRRRERFRKYLKEGFSQELGREDWGASLRSNDELLAAAEHEISGGEPGPATKELAARSAYPLIVSGALTADRGSANSDQPDRRNPGEVIDRMRISSRGVRQLHQALVDFSAQRRPRLIGEDGHVARSEAGSEVTLTDPVLRRIYPRPGTGPVPVPVPVTASERLNLALKELAIVVCSLENAVSKVEAVRAEDGSPAIDVLGADKADCEAWRNVLFEVLDKLPVWKSRSVQRNGAEIGEMDDDDLDDDFDDDFDDGERDGGGGDLDDDDY